MSFDNQILDDKFFKKYLNYKNKYLELKGGMPGKCHKTNDFNFDEYHRIIDTFNADIEKLLDEDIYRNHLSDLKCYYEFNMSGDELKQLYASVFGQENFNLLFDQISSDSNKLDNDSITIKSYDVLSLRGKKLELEKSIEKINPEIKRFLFIFENKYIKLIFKLKLTLMFYLKLNVNNVTINQKLQVIDKISENYFKHLTILLIKFLSSEGRTLFYAKNLLPLIEEQIKKTKVTGKVD
jgi:hypothetical protein